MCQCHISSTFDVSVELPKDYGKTIKFIPLNISIKKRILNSKKIQKFRKNKTREIWVVVQPGKSEIIAFFVQNYNLANFGKKWKFSKFWKKNENLANFGKKWKFWNKLKFWQKMKILEEMKLLTKNENFGRNETFGKNVNFGKKCKFWKQM